MELSQAWLVFAVFVAAGAVKGASGMGLPTVAMSLLGLWMAPVEAAALLVAPSLATNVAQCRGPHLRPLAWRLWPVWTTLALVTVLGPGLAPGTSAGGARQLLGGVLLVYGLWGLWRPELPRASPRSVPLGLGVGIATGLATAATAVFVMPLVPYLQALRLDKDAMVQALGLSFSVATLALALRLQSAGGLVLLSPLAALALLAAFTGLWLGNRIRARLGGPAFQRVLFMVFVGLGVASLWRGA